MKIIRIVAIAFAAAGCASATRPLFRDPAYANRDFTKVAVFAVGMDLDIAPSIESQVCGSLAPSQCVSGKKLFPAGATYTPSEIGQQLTQANVDGILVIVLGDDQVASAYKATIVPASSSLSSTQSSAASLYGNIAAWNAPPQTSVTLHAANIVPMYTYDRAAHAVGGLIDRRNGRTVWGGDLRVTGQGGASVTDKEFIRAATAELVTQLRENRLVKIPATATKKP